MFVSSSLILMPFIPFFFFGLIVMAKLSSTMLKRNGDSEHLGLVLEYKGNPFNVSIWF